VTGQITGQGQIVVSGLTKVYPKVTAVQDLSFNVEPGRVTGFLGPNGSGKTTTMRMILGLVAPTRGSSTIGGVAYVNLPRPLSSVGTLLEASSAHRARSGRNHLRILCAAGGYPAQRADEVLEMVGLTPAGRRKYRGYSLGMKQRLGIAAAMLGDPQFLILDEPANGLDPEGIRWMRTFLRALAAQGRTVLVSSHLLSEMEPRADDLVIIAAGRLVARGRTDQILAGSAAATVRVRTPHAEALTDVLRPLGASVQVDPTGALLITGVEAAQVGKAALQAQAELHELVTDRPDLEQVFLSLTQGMAGIR
jgi:ABC-2 type transport system ATP-binding protein